MFRNAKLEIAKLLITKTINRVTVPEGSVIVSVDRVVYVPVQFIKKAFGTKVILAKSGKTAYIGQAPSVILDNTQGNTSEGGLDATANKAKGVNGIKYKVYPSDGISIEK